ncbi:MAG: helix-turn-helix domain-containing protein [Acidobacteriota bacterium]
MSTALPKRRSVCPVACTLDLIGDKWTLLVIRDLIVGKSTFKEITSSPERVATNILADRLKRLLAHGLIERRPAPDHGGRFTYHLTESGQRLEPVLAAITDWGLEHLEGTEVRVKPPAESNHPTETAR